MIFRRSSFKPRKSRIRKPVRSKRPKRKVIFRKEVKIGFYSLIVGAILFGIYRFLSSCFFCPTAVNVSIHQCGEYACLVEGDVRAQVEELFGGKNLIFTDFGELAKQFKSRNLVISEVRFDRSFLSRKLEVEVVGRKALAVLRSPIPPLSEESSSHLARLPSPAAQAAGGQGGVPRLAQDESQATLSASRGAAEYGNLYFVDEEGVVFAEAKGTFGLPIIPLPEGKKVELGEKIEGNYINTYLEILRVLDKNKINAQNIEVGSDGEVFIYVSQGPEAIILSQKNIEEQIGLLAVILQRYRVEGKRLKKVDLRFEKPVVEY